MEPSKFKRCIFHLPCLLTRLFFSSSSLLPLAAACSFAKSSSGTAGGERPKKWATSEMVVITEIGVSWIHGFRIRLGGTLFSPPKNVYRQIVLQIYIYIHILINIYIYTGSSSRSNELAR